MKKLVIFDLDGTLLNTIEDLGHAANHALQRWGFATHTIASYPFFVGNGVKRLMQRVLPEENRDDLTVDALLRDFREYYDEHCCDYTKPYAGIEDLLAELEDQGIQLAVASNKYHSAAEQIIRHFFPDINWLAVQGHVEGVNVKPDPSVVFGILGRARVAKSDVLYVGDSGIDIETARRACIESVGVTWGFRPEKELVENYADHIVHNPADIFTIATEE